MSYGVTDLFITAVEVRQQAVQRGFKLKDVDILEIAVKQQFNEMYAEANVINSLQQPTALEKIAMGINDMAKAMAFSDIADLTDTSSALFAISHSLDNLTEQVANLQDLQVRIKD